MTMLADFENPAIDMDSPGFVISYRSCSLLKTLTVAPVSSITIRLFLIFVVVVLAMFTSAKDIRDESWCLVVIGLMIEDMFFDSLLRVVLTFLFDCVRI